MLGKGPFQHDYKHVQLDVEGDLNVRGFFGQQDGVHRLASAMCRAE